MRDVLIIDYDLKKLSDAELIRRMLTLRRALREAEDAVAIRDIKQHSLTGYYYKTIIERIDVKE